MTGPISDKDLDVEPTSSEYIWYARNNRKYYFHDEHFSFHGPYDSFLDASAHLHCYAELIKPKFKLSKGMAAACHICKPSVEFAKIVELQEHLRSAHRLYKG